MSWSRVPLPGEPWILVLDGVAQSAVVKAGELTAAELFLSAHTVRDYIKAVFDKVSVSSRGELVAKLFAEHYADPFHDTLVDVH